MKSLRMSAMSMGRGMIFWRPGFKGFATSASSFVAPMLNPQQSQSGFTLLCSEYSCPAQGSQRPDATARRSR